MIKTLIFDIGNVLVGYDWDAFLMNANNNNRTTVERLKSTLFNKTVWDEVDRGVWSEKQLLDAFVEGAPDLEKEIYYFWDHAIFELIRDEYELNPAECVFLDDNADNVAAARECGFNIVHVTDYESAVQGLEELLK